MSFRETVEHNRELFLRYNDIKYQRFQQLIGNLNIKRVINALPILLSTNDRRLPGYVDGDVPCGIAGVVPDEEALRFLQGRFHMATIELATDNPFVEMVAVMGSVGTIAYTKESDYDYWVCVDRNRVTDGQMALFQRKVVLIQEWMAAEGKVEVHLFVNDINCIKRNVFAEDEDEAFGSTVGAVLKDEFFRSSIIVAGKIPFWWVLTRYVTDEEYEELYGKLDEEQRKNHFADLGNLYEISKDDFLGAALFQLIKSLGNPFKSIIKIGVLEKYIFAPERSLLLSQKVRSNILRDEINEIILDSYILMFAEVYKYYEGTLDDPPLLKSLRQNLYLKINPQLSKYFGMKTSQNLPYKVLVMFKYVREWGWTATEIRELDDFENWDYTKLISFWNLVKKFMLISYQKISTTLPHMDLRAKISDSDFKLLSRKIRTHFSSEPDKIDQYVTFKDTPCEAILYIEPTNKSIDDHEWSLTRRNTSETDKFVSTVLRTEHSLVKLVAWTAINQIYSPTGSRIKIQSGYIRINQNLVMEFMNRIHHLFLEKSPALKNEFFLRPSFIMTGMIIVNFGLEKADSIRSIHHLYRTSWGESFLREYNDEKELIRILGITLKDGIVLGRSYDSCCAVVTPEPFKKMYKDIEVAFKEAYEFIVLANPKKSLRFVTELAGQFVTITRDRDVLGIHADPDTVKMLTKVSLKPKGDIVNRFAGPSGKLPVLAALYDKRLGNSITVIYEEMGDHCVFYLLNERGNLFAFYKQSKSKEEALIYLFAFSRNILGRINAVKSLPVINKKIPVYRLAVDRYGKFSFDEETHQWEGLYLAKFNKKKSLLVAVQKEGDGDPLYSIGFENGRMSPFAALAAVPGTVKTLGGLDNTALLVSDMQFTGQSRDDMLKGSSMYFLEKYRLELMIDRAVR